LVREAFKEEETLEADSVATGSAFLIVESSLAVSTEAVLSSTLATAGKALRDTLGNPLDVSLKMEEGSGMYLVEDALTVTPDGLLLASKVCPGVAAEGLSREAFKEEETLEADSVATSSAFLIVESSLEVSTAAAAFSSILVTRDTLGNPLDVPLKMEEDTGTVSPDGLLLLLGNPLIASVKLEDGSGTYLEEEEDALTVSPDGLLLASNVSKCDDDDSFRAEPPDIESSLMLLALVSTIPI
jgi:hypothetical protein